MRGPKASASLSARWPRVHDCQSSYKTNWGKGVDDCFTLLHVCLLYPCQNMCKIWPVRPPRQGSSSSNLWVVTQVFIGGHLHHVPLSWAPTLTLGHQNTHTSSLKGWAIILNGSKWTVTAKSHHYAPWGTGTATARPVSQWRLWLCDLTSPSPREYLTSTKTSLISNTSAQKKRPLRMSLCPNQFVRRALKHVCWACDVIVYATSRTEQNMLRSKLSSWPNAAHFAPFLWERGEEPLLLHFFIHF